MSDITPTWQFVQEVISENIDKADLAAEAAEAALNNLAASVTELPFTAVDTSVGTDAPVVWTATVTGQSVAEEPDYSGTAFPYISNENVSVPGGVTGPADIAFPTITTVPPTVNGLSADALLPSQYAGVSGINFIPPSALPSITTYLQQLFNNEDRTFAADTSFVVALRAAIDGAATRTDWTTTHPWGTDWEASSYASMIERADAVRTQIYNLVNDPASQGLPSVYWDQLASEAAARFAKQKIGGLRRARNSGAASYWGLPTETVLVATQMAEQQAMEQQQAVESEIVKKRSELVREAYFKGIDMIIAIEKQMLDFSVGLKKQAMDMLAQLLTLRFQMYQSNMEQYKTNIDNARLAVQGVDVSNKGAQIQSEAEARLAEAAARYNGVYVQEKSAQIENYKATIATYLQSFAEQVKAWDVKTNGTAKYEDLKLKKVQVDVEHYTAVANKIQSIAQATAALLQGRAQAVNPQIEAEKAAIQLDTAKNSASLDQARITQAAQESNAKLDVAQAQYLASQSATMLQSLAASYVGIYQALLQVSDVSLGSAYGAHDSWSTNASRNQELVW